MRALGLLLALLAGPCAWAGPALVDGTAAVVAKMLITVQDAHFFSALVRFRDGEPALETPEQGDALKSVVQKMALEEMVLAEMRSLGVQEGNRSEVERAVESQKAKGRDGEWKRLLARYGRTEREAVDRLYRSLQVEKFLQKKVETLTPVITDAEVDSYFSQNPKRFRGADLQTLKPKVILLLKKQRMQKGLEEWVRGLKEKYGVTNLLNG